MKTDAFIPGKELVGELEQTITLLMKDSTPGLKARAKIVLKDLGKLTPKTL